MKFKDKGSSEIMRDYLHCSSSTDVEIEGLEPPTANASLKSVDDVLPTSSRSASTRRPVKGKKMADLVGKKPANVVECDSSSDVKRTRTRTPYTGTYGKIYGAISCLVIYDKHLAISGCDGKIHVFSRYRGGEPLLRVFTHSEIVRALHIRPNVGNTYLYSGGLDKTLVISNFKSGTYISEHQCSAGILCSSEGWGKVHLGLTNGMVTVFDLEKYRVESTRVFTSNKAGVAALATAQEGNRRLLCLVEEGQASIMVKDVRTSLFLRSLEGHTKQPLTLQVKNHMVFSGGADKMLQIHNLNTGEMETLLRFQSAVTQLVVENVLIVGERRGVVNVIERKTHKRQRVIYTYDHSPVTALALDEKHQILYIGEENGKVESLSISGPLLNCKFSACKEYAFGTKKHMLTHLIQEHVKPCLTRAGENFDNSDDDYLFKCLWRGCNTFITISDDAQDAEEHMMEHIEAEEQKSK